MPHLKTETATGQELDDVIFGIRRRAAELDRDDKARGRRGRPSATNMLLDIGARALLAIERLIVDEAKREEPASAGDSFGDRQGRDRNGVRCLRRLGADDPDRFAAGLVEAFKPLAERDLLRRRVAELADRVLVVTRERDAARQELRAMTEQRDGWMRKESEAWHYATKLRPVLEAELRTTIAAEIRREAVGPAKAAFEDTARIAEKGSRHDRDL